MTFTFTVTAADWGRIAPELVLAAMALIVMLADLLLPPAAKGLNGTDGTESSIPALAHYLPLSLLALLGLAGALAATIVLFVAGDQHSAFNGMIGSDAGSLYAYIIILSASILGLLLVPGYLQRANIVHQGEFYALWLLATLGMMLMAAATSFLVIFLGLEMLSLALYVLCSFVSRRKSSQEAGMKYFLLSSFASAFLLYGIALTYGATGSTSFAGIHTFLTGPRPLAQTTYHTPTLLLIGMGLLTVGFAFKISAIPFQAWTPDVYAGAPAPVTGFMSVGTKAAALIAFARVFDVVFAPVHQEWLPVIWAIAILTIIGGNVLALAQTNLKRLLAYSSIAHAGYLLIGIVAGGTIGITAILFYLLCYTFLNLGAFGVSSVLEAHNPAGQQPERDARPLVSPAGACRLARLLPVRAGRFPTNGRLRGQVLPVLRRAAKRPPRTAHHRRARQRPGHVLLPEGHRRYVHGARGPGSPVYTRSSGHTAARNGRRVSSRLGQTGALASGTARAGTAVAVRATTSNDVRSGIASEQAAEQWTIAWPTWVSLILSAIGTLAMGTLLPFWLVNVAQYAAQMMQLLK